MLNDFDASRITAFHDRMLQDPAWPPSGTEDAARDERGGAWQWIAANHRFNTLLWNEEDKARRTDVAAAEIATCKRLIDRYNQQRNDAVERIDETVLSTLDGCPLAPDARLHSETAGAMIDRLSILSLKIFHMHEQTLRADADAAHVETCRGKLARLREQRKDLAFCLDRLLAEAAEGRSYFKVYRQFKMYNDPTLNPWLYGKPRAAGAERQAR